MWPFSKTPNPRDEEKQRQYEADLPRMFDSRLVHETEDKMTVWHEVKEVFHDNHGKIGVIFGISFYGTHVLVQQITKNGAISRTQPYWTEHKWFRYDEPFCALCEVCRTDKDHVFVANGKSVRCKCTSIIEIPTDYLPEMDIDRWNAYKMFTGVCVQRK